MISENRVQLLNEFRNIIIKLHKNKIIHGDLHYRNLLVSNKNNDIRIIDFDNCNFKKFKLSDKHVSYFASIYIDKYGINYGLDVYLFNILTFCMLNGLHYSSVLDDIKKEKYGVFNDTSLEKRICNDMLLNKHKYNQEYLINAYMKKLRG